MNIFKSIINYKCPKCRKGDLFVKPFEFRNPLNMNEKCVHCGQLFEPEPGYYYGAMFISYIWTAFAALGIIAIGIFVLKLSVNASFALLIFIGAISYFFVLRVSRSMYIHLDVRYDKKYSSKK